MNNPQLSQRKRGLGIEVFNTRLLKETRLFLQDENSSDNDPDAESDWVEVESGITEIDFNEFERTLSE
jgi:hypothetical protein